MSDLIQKPSPARGQFRISLSQKVASNSDAKVQLVTKQAFKEIATHHQQRLQRLQAQANNELTQDSDAVPISTPVDNVCNAINILDKGVKGKSKSKDSPNGLTGIGPATAAIILSLLDPSCPYFDDDVYLAFDAETESSKSAGKSSKARTIPYTVDGYKKLLIRSREVGDALGWDARRVGRAIWAVCAGRKLGTNFDVNSHAEVDFADVEDVLDEVSEQKKRSFAHVYLAYDSVTSTNCAVKCLPKKGLDLSKMTAQRREAQALEALNGHPNIVKLIRVIPDDRDWLLIVMEFCELDLFEAIMQNGGFPDNVVRDIFGQLCDGLMHCHSRGYFHRDIKPENCLVDLSSMTVKLTDFGLVTRDTWSREMGCGSSRYLAPEACASADGSRGYSPAASDIWAMGIILINLLFSKNPWYEACPSDPIFSQFIGGDPDVLRRQFDLSPELDFVLRRVFSLDPAHRIPLADFKRQIVNMKSFVSNPVVASTPSSSSTTKLSEPAKPILPNSNVFPEKPPTALADPLFTSQPRKLAGAKASEVSPSPPSLPTAALATQLSSLNIVVESILSDKPREPITVQNKPQSETLLQPQPELPQQLNDSSESQLQEESPMHPWGLRNPTERVKEQFHGEPKDPFGLWPEPSRRTPLVPNNLSLGREGIGRLGISRLTHSRSNFKYGRRRQEGHNPAQAGPSNALSAAAAALHPLANAIAGWSVWAASSAWAGLTPTSGEPSTPSMPGAFAAEVYDSPNRPLLQTNGADSSPIALNLMDRMAGGIIDHDYESDDESLDGEERVPDEEDPYESVRHDKRRVPDLETGGTARISTMMGFRRMAPRVNTTVGGPSANHAVEPPKPMDSPGRFSQITEESRQSDFAYKASYTKSSSSFFASTDTRQQAGNGLKNVKLRDGDAGKITLDYSWEAPERIFDPRIPHSPSRKVMDQLNVEALLTDAANAAADAAASVSEADSRGALVSSLISPVGAATSTIGSSARGNSMEDSSDSQSSSSGSSMNGYAREAYEDSSESAPNRRKTKSQTPLSKVVEEKDSANDVDANPDAIPRSSRKGGSEETIVTQGIYDFESTHAGKASQPRKPVDIGDDDSEINDKGTGSSAPGRSFAQSLGLQRGLANIYDAGVGLLVGRRKGRRRLDETDDDGTEGDAYFENGGGRPGVRDEEGGRWAAANSGAQSTPNVESKPQPDRHRHKNLPPRRFSIPSPSQAGDTILPPPAVSIAVVTAAIPTSETDRNNADFEKIVLASNRHLPPKIPSAVPISKNNGNTAAEDNSGSPERKGSRHRHRRRKDSDPSSAASHTFPLSPSPDEEDDEEIETSHGYSPDEVSKAKPDSQFSLHFGLLGSKARSATGQSGSTVTESKIPQSKNAGPTASQRGSARRPSYAKQDFYHISSANPSASTTIFPRSGHQGEEDPGASLPLFNPSAGLSKGEPLETTDPRQQLVLPLHNTSTAYTSPGAGDLFVRDSLPGQFPTQPSSISNTTYGIQSSAAIQSSAPSTSFSAIVSSLRKDPVKIEPPPKADSNDSYNPFRERRSLSRPTRTMLPQSVKTVVTEPFTKASLPSSVPSFVTLPRSKPRESGHSTDFNYTFGKTSSSADDVSDEFGSDGVIVPRLSSEPKSSAFQPYETRTDTVFRRDASDEGSDDLTGEYEIDGYELSNSLVGAFPGQFREKIGKGRRSRARTEEDSASIRSLPSFGNHNIVRGAFEAFRGMKTRPPAPKSPKKARADAETKSRTKSPAKKKQQPNHPWMPHANAEASKFMSTMLHSSKRPVTASDEIDRNVKTTTRTKKDMEDEEKATSPVDAAPKSPKKAKTDAEAKSPTKSPTKAAAKSPMDGTCQCGGIKVHVSDAAELKEPGFCQAVFGGNSNFYFPAALFCDADGKLSKFIKKPNVHSFYKSRIIDMKDGIKKYEGFPGMSAEVAE
ncbi:hypothetical protein HDU97_003902 [Phlyctochytrium planicorne]|nr:hypothetical protein HDU97_003902 [Phlyctochytrium planicorne]